MSQEQLKSLEGYQIRQLTGEEWPLYKKMRLEALKNEPAMFRVTTPPEVDLNDNDWKERLDLPRAVFGLYYNDILIGITSIILLNKKEAYLGQSYIIKEHRGKGLSSLLYNSRIAWAKNMNLNQLLVSHRESNVASKAANQNFGFIYTHREPCQWQDGHQEDVLYYRLSLK
ncbi:GNAT family N-acetyltransferase [Chryseobacterium aureum]|uniref:GNAT family N-acetyltransferase n=1 Tax=Chryseobacterium aureum TaxID=2497456 RepID=UPI0013DF9B40|nr:GNAT family N-acetyltransferase [Chryseobacterium aureum]